MIFFNTKTRLAIVPSEFDQKIVHMGEYTACVSFRFHEKSSG